MNRRRFTTTYSVNVYHHESCEVESSSWRGVLDTTLCDEVFQWLAAGRWFCPSTPVSFTNKTDIHDITEILLKVALSAITYPWMFNLRMFSPCNLIICTQCSDEQYLDCICLSWSQRNDFGKLLQFVSVVCGFCGTCGWNLFIMA